MDAADTAASKLVTGYLTQEQITLTVTPSGTAYSWSIAKPKGDSVRSDLSGATGASVTFAPQLAGYYVITCIVDSTTTYVIRIGTVAVTVSSSVPVIHHMTLADSVVPAPTLGGVNVYYSTDQNWLVTKDSAGTVTTLGATGPAGPAGPQGPTGPAGPAGASGESTSISSGTHIVHAVASGSGWADLAPFTPTTSDSRKLYFSAYVTEDSSLTGAVRLWDTVTGAAVTNSSTNFVGTELVYADYESASTFAVTADRLYRIEAQVVGALGVDYYGVVQQISVEAP